MAVERMYRGLTQEEEREWQGDYYFIQIADPQDRCEIEQGIKQIRKGGSVGTSVPSLVVTYVAPSQNL